MIGIMRTITSWVMALFFTATVGYQDPPEPPAIPDKPETLITQEITVMSFNIYFMQEGEYSMANRFNGVVQTIRREAPDSFGLQEANEPWKLALWREFREDYGMAAWWGRDWGLGESVPIFYLRERYDLMDSGVFWHSDFPRIPVAGWDASMPRIAGWAILRDKETGFTYLHVNSHFDHIGPIARANSSTQVANFINAKNIPAVFTADVNARPNTLPTQNLEAGGLIDMRYAAIENDRDASTFHGYSGSVGDRVIDYIYANHFLHSAARHAVIRDKYDGIYPSDHFAVVATLTLGNWVLEDD